MSDPLYWDDAYSIALLLNAAHPDVGDPSQVMLPQLKTWVTALNGFADDHETAPVEQLEQIQVEWVELK